MSLKREAMSRACPRSSTVQNAGAARRNPDVTALPLPVPTTHVAVASTVPSPRSTGAGTLALKGVCQPGPRATELVPDYCLSKTRISSSYRVWLPSVPVCLLVSVFPSAETVIRPPELTRPSGTYSFTVPPGRL